MLRKPGEYERSATRSAHSSNRRKTQEGPDDIVRKLQRLAPNKKCADCSAKLPQVCNLTHGTFVCLSCGGIHREFNHRIKGIGHSSFTADEASFLKERGNEVVNAHYMKTYNASGERLRPPDGTASIPVDGQLLRVWIRRKYMDNAWTGGSRSGSGSARGGGGGGVGVSSNGGASGGYNRQPTRVQIPPKVPVQSSAPIAAPAPAPAPAADLLGGWDASPARGATTATAAKTSDDAEWDAFGKSRSNASGGGGGGGGFADFGSSQAATQFNPQFPPPAPQQQQPNGMNMGMGMGMTAPNQSFQPQFPPPQQPGQMQGMGGHVPVQAPNMPPVQQPGDFQANFHAPQQQPQLQQPGAFQANFNAQPNMGQVQQQQQQQSQPPAFQANFNAQPNMGMNQQPQQGLQATPPRPAQQQPVGFQPNFDAQTPNAMVPPLVSQPPQQQPQPQQPQPATMAPAAAGGAFQANFPPPSPQQPANMVPPDPPQQQQVPPPPTMSHPTPNLHSVKAPAPSAMQMSPPQQQQPMFDANFGGQQQGGMNADVNNMNMGQVPVQAPPAPTPAPALAVPNPAMHPAMQTNFANFGGNPPHPQGNLNMNMNHAQVPPQQQQQQPMPQNGMGAMNVGMANMGQQQQMQMPPSGGPPQQMQQQPGLQAAFPSPDQQQNPSTVEATNTGVSDSAAGGDGAASAGASASADPFDAFDGLAIGEISGHSQGSSSMSMQPAMQNMPPMPPAPPAVGPADSSLVADEKKTEANASDNTSKGPKYSIGDTLEYKDSQHNVSTVEVLRVHLDDDLVPFYDIRMPDGREKQTDDGHLSLPGTNAAATTAIANASNVMDASATVVPPAPAAAIPDPTSIDVMSNTSNIQGREALMSNIHALLQSLTQEQLHHVETYIKSLN